MDLPREFRLVAACCRWPPSPARDSAVLAAAEGIDWALAARIAARHRVEGLVWNALRQAGAAVPEAVAERLREASARIMRQNLALTAESLRLAGLLDEAGIRHLFVKGVSLSMLVYGSIGPKMGWDIDLLVAPEAVEAAALVLEAAGYRLALPEGARGRERIGLWHRHWKESVWTTPDGRLTVELHSRLNDNPMLLPSVGPDSPSRPVEVSKGRFLATLRTDELFAYLCVHGASSAWFRLKWIADVGALIGACPPEEIERLYRRSQALGAGRAPAQALSALRAPVRHAPAPRPRRRAPLRPDQPLAPRHRPAQARRPHPDRRAQPEAARHRHHPPDAIRSAARTQVQICRAPPPARQPRRPSRGAAAARRSGSSIRWWP